MRRLLTAFVVLTALVVGAALAATSVSAAAGPPGSPVTLRSEGFEILPYPADLSVRPITIAGYPTSASWGRVSQRRHGGSYGLWCSGSGAANWSAYGGMYLLNSRGNVVFDLPQLAEHYRSSVSFWYTFPSVSSDENAFVTSWGRSGDYMTDARYPLPKTAAGQWRQQVWDLSSPQNRVALSRAAGYVNFRWYSPEIETDTPTAGPGEGVTIDDVVVTGYRFGPVRSLAATKVAEGVRLSWAVPYRSTVGTAVEERPVAYRVWRAAAAAPTDWTELTASGRLPGTSFVDATAPEGQNVYVVQAWEPGDGPGYGMLADPVSATPLATTPTLGIRASATAVAYGAPVVLTATLTRGPLPQPGTSVVFETYSNGWRPVGTVSTGSNGTAAFTVRPYVRASYRARASLGGVPVVSPGVYLTPKAYLTTPAAPTVVRRGVYFAVSGYLKPRHTRGTKAIVLKCYRYENGRFVLRKSQSVAVSDVSSYSRYSARVSLPYAGRWRVVAYHADAGHSPTYSSPRAVSAR